MVKMVNREQMLMELYKSAFPAVAKYAARMGGSVDDARDIFQDALVIYYEKVVAGDLTVANSKAYLLGITKHLWFKKYGSKTTPCRLMIHLSKLMKQNSKFLKTKCFSF